MFDRKYRTNLKVIDNSDVEFMVVKIINFERKNNGKYIINVITVKK